MCLVGRSTLLKQPGEMFGETRGINKIYLFNGLFSTFKNNIVHLLILWCVSQSPVRREGAVVLGRTYDRTHWLSGDQKLTSEFPTFACVDYVRLPVIVRLAQECRTTFVWNTYRII